MLYILLQHKAVLDQKRRRQLKHNDTWSLDIDYEENKEEKDKEDLLGYAQEALSRFYQKENKRSKTVKQKKHCWQ